MRSTIANPVFKDTITFLQQYDTGNNASYHLFTVKPGGGNKPHTHRSVEQTFTAVKGILGLQLRTKRKLLLPGESYTVQKNELHHFFNNTQEEICFRVSFTPAHTGMEYALRILYGLTQDGQIKRNGYPKSLYALALIARLGDSRLAGSASLLNPFIPFLAAKARKKGLERNSFNANVSKAT